MPELALFLYLVGFAATATTPIDDRRLAEKPWLTFAIAAAWPAFALLTVGARFWRVMRG